MYLDVKNTLTRRGLVPIEAFEVYVVIGSGNGLSPVGHKAIPKTSDDMSETETPGTNSRDI